LGGTEDTQDDVLSPFGDDRPGNVLRYGTNTAPGTTPMQDAFTSAIAANDLIYVPAGIYLFGAGAAVTLPAGKTIYGDGYTSQIISATADDIQITVTGSNTAIRDLRITGGGRTLDESGAPFGSNIHAKGTNTSARLENLIVEGCFIENGHDGVNADYFDKLKITNNTFLNTNAAWTQIHCWDCKHGVISGNTMDGGGVMSACIGLWGITANDEKCEAMVVTGNTCLEATDESIQVMGSNNSITGNTVRRTAADQSSVGIQIHSKGTQDDTNDNVIDGNTISGPRYGIYIVDALTSATDGPKNTVISGNTVSDCLGYGILVQHESHGTNISGNTVSGILDTYTAGDGIHIQSSQVKCDNNFVTGCADNGIKTSGTFSDITICNNTVEGNTGDGIEIDANATGVKLIGNTVLNNGAWGIATNAAVLAANEYNSGSGNSSGMMNSAISALADDATPSIAAGGNVWRTGGTTTITNILGGHKGQTITIFTEHDTVQFTTSATLNAGSQNLVTADGDMTMWALDNNGTSWRLLAFVDDSADNSGGA